MCDFHAKKLLLDVFLAGHFFSEEDRKLNFTVLCDIIGCVALLCGSIRSLICE